jgi:hypothetical protein
MEEKSVHHLRSCDLHEFQNGITKLCASRSNGLKAETEEQTKGQAPNTQTETHTHTQS